MCELDTFPPGYSCRRNSFIRVYCLPHHATFSYLAPVEWGMISFYHTSLTTNYFGWNKALRILIVNLRPVIDRGRLVDADVCRGRCFLRACDYWPNQRSSSAVVMTNSYVSVNLCCSLVLTSLCKVGEVFSLVRVSLRYKSRGGLVPLLRARSASLCLLLCFFVRHSPALPLLAK